MPAPTDKIKIFCIAPSLGSGHTGGGAERFMVTLLNHIDLDRFFPQLICVKAGQAYAADLRDRIHVIELNLGKIRFAPFRIIRLAWRHRPDIIFVTLGLLNAILIGFRFLMPGKIKFVCRETAIPSMYHREVRFPLLINLLYRYRYDKYDTIICQSLDMKMDLIGNYNISPEKLVVIHNPLDLQRIDRKSREKKKCFDNRKINLLAVGRLTYQKGFDLLLQAFSMIKSVRYHLTILGNGPDHDLLSNMTRELGIESRVHFAGFQNNPYPYMKQADLLVLSSRYEGFPNVILEANACGTPVVAFECPGGLNEIVIEGVNGWLVENGNVPGLAVAIARACSRKQAPGKIVASIRRRFDVQKISDEYQSIFYELASLSDSPSAPVDSPDPTCEKRTD